MTTKNASAATAKMIAAARQRAEKTRQQLKLKPGQVELLTPQELADASPYYLVLRSYIGQLKKARVAAGLTLADLSSRTSLALETLSRLETGALTNPTWKTLGVYAAAVGLRPRLIAEVDKQREESR